MIRVLVDTNIVISALLFPASVPAQALALVVDEHVLVLTQWVLDEFQRVVGEKRPELLSALDAVVTNIGYELAEPAETGLVISDPNDQPILDAAIAGAVDVIVTGDQRFHALDIETPRVLGAAISVMPSSYRRVGTSALVMMPTKASTFPMSLASSASESYVGDRARNRASESTSRPASTMRRWSIARIGGLVV